MTPKEKAEELVYKFNHYTIKSSITYSDGITIECLIDAKKCALIAVDEIIAEFGTYFKVNTNNKYVSYWQEVKQEIEKL